MKWFTADQHFFHRNIIGYCDRPFKNAHQMNTTIIDNYNKVVKPEDTVYHLGDFTMLSSGQVDKIAKIVENLNGTKHLILGNHDKLKPFEYTDIGFASVHTALELSVRGMKVYLAHDPAFAQIPESIWLCGHIHNLWDCMFSKKTGNFVINCGVDVNNFAPVSEDTLVLKLSKMIRENNNAIS